MVIVHDAPLGASQPDQPAKIDPAPASAVNVTDVPGGYASEQSAPQSIPGPFTDPNPVPPFDTDNATSFVTVSTLRAAGTAAFTAAPESRTASAGTSKATRVA